MANDTNLIGIHKNYDPTRNRKGKRKKKGGTIVPVGGETPIGMYDGATGQLKAPAKKREFVVAQRDNSGQMQYKPGFSIINGKRLKPTKGVDIDVNRYRYEGLDEAGTSTPMFSDLILGQNESKARAEEDSNIWAMFKRNISNGVEENSVLSAVASSFSTVTGWLGTAIEQYDDKLLNPQRRVIGTGTAFVDVTSGTTGDWSKSWDGTYGLHYGQIGSNFLRNTLSPQKVREREVLPDGLTPEQFEAAKAATPDSDYLQSGNPEDHEAIRQQAESNALDRYTSFMLTLGTELVADPGVIVGKAIKGGKAAALGYNWVKQLGPQGAVKMFDDAALIAKGHEAVPFTDDAFEGLTARQTSRAKKAAYKAHKRANSAAMSMKAIAESDSAMFIQNTSLVRNSSNPQALAGILRDAKDVDSVTEVFKYFIGDDVTRNAVNSRYDEVAESLKNAKAAENMLGTWNPATRKWEQMPQTGLVSKLTNNAFENMDEERKALTEFMDDLKSKEASLAAIIDNAQSIDLVTQGTLSKGGISNFAKIEEYRLEKARKGELVMDTKVIQRNPFSTAVRVVRWAGQQRPDNWIPIAGISDTKSAGESMTAWLRSADVLTQKQRVAYYEGYITAVTKGDAAVGDYVRKMEHDIAMRYVVRDGVRRGIIPKHPSTEYGAKRKLALTKKAAEGSDVFSAPGSAPKATDYEGRMRPLKDKPKGDATLSELGQSELIALAGRNDPGSLRSFDAALSEMGQSTKRRVQIPKELREEYRGALADWQSRVDEYLARDEMALNWAKDVRAYQAKRDGATKQLGDRGGYGVDGNELLTIPQWETQLAGSLPLMDWKRYSIVARDLWEFNGKNTGKTALTRAVYGVAAANRGIQRLYRPLILLSLKYTPRNVFDGVLRNAATIGASFITPEAGVAMGKNVVNRSRRAGIRAQGHTKKSLQRDIIKSTEYLYSKEGAATTAASLRRELAELNPEDLDAEAYETLAGLFEAQAAREAKRDEILGKIDYYDGVVAASQARIAAMNEKLEALSLPRVRASDFDMHFGTKADGVTFSGFTGEGKAIPREVILSEFSAQDTMTQMFNLRARTRMNEYHKQFGFANSRVSKADANYWDELHHFGTRVLRGSQLAKLRLQGASDEAVLAFMRTPEGRNVKRFADSTGKQLDTDADVLTWFDEGRDSVLKHFPDPAIRQKILDGKDFSVGELKASQEQYDLPAIVGYELISEHGLPKGAAGKSIGAAWNKITQDLFNLLGNIPETAMARHPMGDAIYRARLSELVQFHGVDYAKRNMDELDRKAMRRALRDVKETQYTVERYSNLAGMLEPIAPFFQAQLNTVRVWSKIIANDPSVLARGQQLWNLASGNMTIPVGEIANADVPVWSSIMGATGLDRIDEQQGIEVTPRNIASAVFQPNLMVDNWMSEDESNPMGETSAASFIIGQFLPQPGGPWITTPANQIVKMWEASENPNFVQEFLVDVAKLGTPFGPTNDEILPLGLDANLPSWMKATAAAIKGEGSDRLLARVAAVYKSEQIEWNKRGAPAGEEPTWDDAIKTAKAMAVWDAMAKFTLPFSGFKETNANTFISDDIKAMYDQGMEFDEVQQKVYEKYGRDYAPLLYSSQDKFAGVPATMEAVKWLGENEAMLNEYLAGSRSDEERLARMTMLREVIPELKHGEFDARAAAHLRIMEVPGEKRTYFDADENATRLTGRSEVDRGWFAFNQLDAVHKADKDELDMKYQGRKRDKDYWARRNHIDAVHGNVLNQIKQDFPGWNAEIGYRDNTTIKPQVALSVIERVRANPKVAKKMYQANPEYWATIDTFLEIRQATQVEIARAGNTRNPFERAAKERVKNVITDYGDAMDRLRASNTQFDYMYKRFFLSEQYQRDDQGNQVGPQIGYSGFRVPRPWTEDERRRRGFAA